MLLVQVIWYSRYKYGDELVVYMNVQAFGKISGKFPSKIISNAVEVHDEHVNILYFEYSRRVHLAQNRFQWWFLVLEML